MKKRRRKKAAKKKYLKTKSLFDYLDLVMERVGFIEFTPLLKAVSAEYIINGEKI